METEEAEEALRQALQASLAEGAGGGLAGPEDELARVLAESAREAAAVGAGAAGAEDDEELLRALAESVREAAAGDVAGGAAEADMLAVERELTLSLMQSGATPLPPPCGPRQSAPGGGAAVLPGRRAEPKGRRSEPKGRRAEPKGRRAEPKGRRSEPKGRAGGAGLAGVPEETLVALLRANQHDPQVPPTTRPADERFQGSSCSTSAGPWSHPLAAAAAAALLQAARTARRGRAGGSSAAGGGSAPSTRTSTAGHRCPWSH